MLFFFQAEGGIRDIGVTGVQTCALPICLRARPGPCRALPWLRAPPDAVPDPPEARIPPLEGAGRGAALAHELDLAVEIRSEERRVGKECRSRWSPYH